MYAGRITVGVLPSKSGKTTLYAYADGLRTADVLTVAVAVAIEESYKSFLDFQGFRRVDSRIDRGAFVNAPYKIK